MDKRYTINLLGVGITIRSEEDLAYIEQLEKKVKDTMQDVRDELGLSDNLQVAIMTSIFLADENFKLLVNKKSDQSLDDFRVNRQITQTIKDLDGILDDSFNDDYK